MYELSPKGVGSISKQITVDGQTWGLSKGAAGDQDACTEAGNVKTPVLRQSGSELLFVASGDAVGETNYRERQLSAESIVRMDVSAGSFVAVASGFSDVRSLDALGDTHFGVVSGRFKGDWSLWLVDLRTADVRDLVADQPVSASISPRGDMVAVVVAGSGELRFVSLPSE